MVYDAGRSMLHIGGMTASPDMPTTGGCFNDENSGGLCDIYVAAFNSTNMGLSYCTYIGGSGEMSQVDMVADMAARPDGSVVVAGSTSSGDFPTAPGAYSRTFQVGMDGVVFVMKPTPILPPGAPTGLTAMSGDRTVDLAWEPPEGAGGNIRIYRVYRGDSSGAETLLKEVFRTLFYTDDGLVNGKHYYYRVSAVNTAGEGPMSEEVRVRPLGIPMETFRGISTGR